MRRILTLATGAVVVTGILAAGVAVAGLASTSSPLATGQTTSEETTEKPTTTRYRAALTTRAEVPKPEGVRAGAGGTFVVPLTNDQGTYSIAWTLTFRNLTGRATAAHIHRGKPGKAGPVVVSLCGPCRSGRKGKAKVSKAVAAAIEAGRAYVNVHTARNPAGEIRGQIRKAR
jgi:CHRD domain